MLIPFLIIILLMGNLLFTSLLVIFPIDFFHLLGSFINPVLGIALLAIFSYFFGE